MNPPPLPTPPKTFAAYFFRTVAGGEPVRDALKALSPVDRIIVGTDIMKVELGGPSIGLPTVDGLGGGLYEVRSTIADGRIEYRILFVVEGPYLVLLHAFEKTKKATPLKEKNLALKRWKEAKGNQP